MSRQSRTLLALVGPTQAAWSLVLMIALAASEGIGLLLLLPILAAVSGSESLGHGMPARLAAGLIGQPALGPLLTVFVALIIVRGALLVARMTEAARIERRVVESLRARSRRTATGRLARAGYYASGR